MNAVGERDCNAQRKKADGIVIFFFLEAARSQDLAGEGGQHKKFKMEGQ